MSKSRAARNQFSFMVGVAPVTHKPEMFLHFQDYLENLSRVVVFRLLSAKSPTPPPLRIGKILASTLKFGKVLVCVATLHLHNINTLYMCSMVLFKRILSFW